MHRVAPQVAAAVDLPLLHIADATADAVLARGITRVGLLGTIFTMEQDFYTGKLRGRGIEVDVPAKADRELVDRVIFDELCKGEFRDDSRREFVRIINGMAERGRPGRDPGLHRDRAAGQAGPCAHTSFRHLSYSCGRGG